MNLLEMFDLVPDGYQDVEDDNSTLNLDDLRKSRLTLKQINKLRRMQEVRTFERNEKLERIKSQYSQSSGESSMEL